MSYSILRLVRHPRTVLFTQSVVRLYLEPYCPSGPHRLCMQLQCRSSLMLHRSSGDKMRLQFRNSSNTPPSQLVQLTVLQRVGKFLRDNPYTKFSLILCAVVLCLSVGFDLYTKLKKRKIPEVIVFPPRVGHFTVERSTDIGAIERKLQTLKKGRCAILYIEGVSGAGKTELACQYAKYIVGSSSKWLGLRSVRPTILYVNSGTEELLEDSMREAAFSLGLKERDFTTNEEQEQTWISRLTTLAAALRSKLASNKLPWLIVVDDLNEETLPGFVASFASESEEWDWGRGSVIVTTRDTTPPNCPPESRMPIDPRVSSDVALELLKQLGDVRDSDREASKLIEQLQCCPLAIALAASTVKLYSSCLESNVSPLAAYRDILNCSLNSNPSRDEIICTTLSLYLEAASTDPKISHAFDLFGSCDLKHPIPVPLVTQYLANPFYKIPDPDSVPTAAVESLPPSIPNEPAGGIVSTTGAYLSQLKSMLPFGKQAVSLPDPLPTLEESVQFLRNSPVFSFKKYGKTGFEVVHVHASAREQLPLHFNYTMQKLLNTHSSEAEDLFNRTAWFRQYRSFNPEHSLEKYLRSLPGVSAPGVLTHNQFQSIHPPFALSAPGTRLSSDSELQYSEYIHLVSHYHRVVSAMLAELKLTGGDMQDTLLRKYLQPHLNAVSQYPLLSDSDKLSCSYGLISIGAAFSQDNQVLLQKFESLLAEQKSVLGSQHPTVARTLTDMADLKYSMSDVLGAEKLLELALHIYEQLPPQSADNYHHLELGLTLSSMGIVYSSLGEKEKCRSILERTLGVYQTVPPDGNITQRQRKRVASTLTDIAHAYLSLGDVNVAKKYIDLAILAQRHLYPDAHSEVIRTLNIMSIAYLLLGDKAESQKLRLEAGNLQRQIDSHPLFL